MSKERKSPRVPLRKAILIELVVIVTIAAFLLPGGQDLHAYYRPFVSGCLTCGYNPWHASWILAPIRLIPPAILWPVWVFLTVIGLIWASDRLGTNAIYVLLSFPALGLIWLGQVDVVVVVGLTLALLSPDPYLRGVGLLLASIKPHVSGIAILILLWHEEERLKTLLIPGLVLVASVLVWGVDWPLRWIMAREPRAMPVWGLATLFPWALVAFLGIFLVKDRRSQVTVALLASALAVPWFGIYSYTVFLAFFAPWWAVPLSYAWALAYPWYGNRALSFAWVLPLGLLIAFLWPPLRERWPSLARLPVPAFRRSQSVDRHE